MLLTIAGGWKVQRVLRCSFPLPPSLIVIAAAGSEKGSLTPLSREKLRLRQRGSDFTKYEVEEKSLKRENAFL